MVAILVSVVLMVVVKLGETWLPEELMLMDGSVDDRTADDIMAEGSVTVTKTVCVTKEVCNTVVRVHDGIVVLLVPTELSTVGYAGESRVEETESVSAEEVVDDSVGDADVVRFEDVEGNGIEYAEDDRMEDAESG